MKHPRASHLNVSRLSGEVENVCSAHCSYCLVPAAAKSWESKGPRMGLQVLQRKVSIPGKILDKPTFT